MPLLSTAELNAFLHRYFPQLLDEGQPSIVVESTGEMEAVLRLVEHDRHLRPGGTISGPAMFTLADVGLYATILAQIGPVGHAVTTSMNMNFMRKPPSGDLIARCKLFKIGKQLAVGEACLYPEGSEEMVAHATGTYSIPPRK
ncbi:MAG: PaaI family thioesterase [Beijerinckiaceae bacterium]|jgi:uncharacterized protein (TIGR00369 family)